MSLVRQDTTKSRDAAAGGCSGWFGRYPRLERSRNASSDIDSATCRRSHSRHTRGRMTATLGAATLTVSPTGGQPVVRLRDVFCVHRSDQGEAAALQGTNLEVAGGEVLCVLGPSGALLNGTVDMDHGFGT